MLCVNRTRGQLIWLPHFVWPQLPNDRDFSDQQRVDETPRLSIYELKDPVRGSDSSHRVCIIGPKHHRWDTRVAWDWRSRGGWGWGCRNYRSWAFEVTYVNVRDVRNDNPTIVKDTIPLKKGGGTAQEKTLEGQNRGKEEGTETPTDNNDPGPCPRNRFYGCRTVLLQFGHQIDSGNIYLCKRSHL